MDDELRKLKFLLVSLVLLAVSCYFAYDELTYLIRGRDASAAVTKVTGMTRRTRYGERAFRQVHVSIAGITDGEIDVGADWTPPPNGMVQVRYTLDGRMRLAGQVNWIGIGMFVVAFSIVLFFGIRLFLQARAATQYLSGDQDRP